MSHEMNLLKQAQEMNRLLREVHRELGERVVEGSAGGGADRCTVTGQLEVRAVRIDPQVVDPEDVASPEVLITIAGRSAVNAACGIKEA